MIARSRTTIAPITIPAIAPALSVDDGVELLDVAAAEVVAAAEEVGATVVGVNVALIGVAEAEADCDTEPDPPFEVKLT